MEKAKTTYIHVHLNYILTKKYGFGNKKGITNEQALRRDPHCLNASAALSIESFAFQHSFDYFAHKIPKNTFKKCNVKYGFLGSSKI